MLPEEKERLLQRIRSLGFDPFPSPTEEFESNPGRIIPPAIPKPEDWLTVSQAGRLSGKASRTIYRWQPVALWINFTTPVEGSDRDDDRHYVYKEDFFRFMSERNSKNIEYLDDDTVNRMSAIMSIGLTDKISDVPIRPTGQNQMSKGVSGVSKDVGRSIVPGHVLVALSNEVCQSVDGARRRIELEIVAAIFIILGSIGAGIGVLAVTNHRQIAGLERSYTTKLDQVSSELRMAQGMLSRVEGKIDRESRDSVWVVERAEIDKKP